METEVTYLTRGPDTVRAQGRSVEPAPLLSGLPAPCIHLTQLPHIWFASSTVLNSSSSRLGEEGSGPSHSLALGTAQAQAPCP